ncbi:MAG: iron ABC transporter permease [Comamonas sp.]
MSASSPASTASQRVLDDYARLVRRRLLIVLALLALLLLSLLADVTTGPSGLTLADTWAALTGQPEVSRAVAVIVWDVRLPIALMALVVGAALALSGAEMQTMLNNPLASPFTLGVSAAAALGAGLAIVLGVGIPFVPQGLLITANAFLFALASILLLQFMSRGRGSRVESIVLFGIALGFTFNALTGLLQFVASADTLQQLVFWTMGSLARSDWTTVSVLLAIVLLVLPFSLRAAWQMTALRLGEDRARSYGIDVARLRFLSLLRVSLLASTAVAFVGTIGFVGLVGPHIARLLVGEDHRFFLPAAALTGALVMSLASIASKMIVPGVLLPVGIVTAFVGLPVFFSLIYKQQGRS